MALVCNIDQLGRTYRYRIGFALVLIGGVVGVIGSALVGGKLPWLVAGLLAVGGLFSLFEANRGWCVMRALGVKTKY